MSQTPSATAYCFVSSKWESNVWTMHVKYYVPESWESAVSSARSQWNNTSSLHYNISFESSNWWNFNFDNQDFAYYGYPDVPGITSRQNISGGEHNRADVHLNNNYTWNTGGVMNQSQRKADVRTVATHEIGHATGLAHPENCGAMTNAEQNASMTPDWTQKWTTNSDDDSGNEDLYP